MAGVAVPRHAVDRDRLELEVRHRGSPEPADDLDRLAGEIAGAEEAEEPFPDPQRLAVVEEQDSGRVAHHEVFGPDQAGNALADDRAPQPGRHRANVRDLDLVQADP